MLLSPTDIEKKLQRLGYEIAETLYNKPEPLIIIGIKQAGLLIANKMVAYLQQAVNNEIIVLEMDMNKQLPKEATINSLIDFTGKHVVIIDDVTNTGKTLTYALLPILNFYPASISTLVLVERMHNSFAVKPNFVGLSIATAPQDFIEVICNGNIIEGAFLRTDVSAI